MILKTLKTAAPYIMLTTLTLTSVANADVASLKHSATMSVAKYGITATAGAIKNQGQLCVGMTPEKFQRLTTEQKEAAIACDMTRGFVKISERGRKSFYEKFRQLNWVDFIQVVNAKPHPVVVLEYATCGASCAHVLRYYSYTDYIDPARSPYYGSSVRTETSLQAFAQMGDNPEFIAGRITAVSTVGKSTFDSHYGGKPATLYLVHLNWACGASHDEVLAAYNAPHIDSYVESYSTRADESATFTYIGKDEHDKIADCS